MQNDRHKVPAFIVAWSWKQDSLPPKRVLPFCTPTGITRKARTPDDDHANSFANEAQKSKKGRFFVAATQSGSA
jgi:hypothetical protein